MRGERVDLVGEAVMVAAGGCGWSDSAADATLDVPRPRGRTLTIDSASR